MIIKLNTSAKIDYTNDLGSNASSWNSGFDILRIISIIGVIIMHVTSMYGIDVKVVSIDSFFLYLFLYSFSWSVPIFFMISGALLLSKSETTQDFYSKRFNKILIPTLFWSAVYLSINYFVNGFGLFNLIALFIKAKPYYHLWFMFAIIGLYLFTPIFRIIIKNTSDKERWIMILIIFSMSIIQNYLNIYLQNTLTIFTIFIPYIGFYFLGYELYKSKISFPSAALIIGFIIFTTLIIIFGYFSNTFFSLKGNKFASFLSPLVIGQAVALFILISHYRSNIINIQKISFLTYGVYLIHPIFIKIYENLFLSNKYQLLHIFLATLFTIIMAFIATAILKKFRFTSNII
jgi:surface polysaccharide O-acyltransferase-like enzyme